MPALVPGVLELSATSLAVSVFVPTELSVTLNCLAPATNAAFAGSVASASLDVIATTSVTELTTFQLSSTAFTVALKGVDGTCVLGDQILPLAVPGAELSPGTKTCSFVNASALTTTLPEVALVKLPALKTTFIVSATG